MILFLLLTGANSLAQSETEIVGVILTTDQQPLSGVEVKVIGGGRDVTTTSGEFRIKLPTSSVGQRVVLQVTKIDWTISDPRELHIIVPADPVQNPLIIRMKRSIGTRQSSSNTIKGGTRSRKSTLPLESKTRNVRARATRSTSDKTIVLVANFSGVEEQSNDITGIIIEQLRSATRGYSDILIQPLGETITVEAGGEVARAKGKERRAAIVLWGWYSKRKENIRISAYFEVLQTPSLLSLRQENRILLLPISELESFGIQFRLSNEMSYLTLLTVGLARLEAEDYDGALDRFTSALTLKNIPDQMVDPADLYFYRGLTYFVRASLYFQKDMDRAVADFNQAIKLNGNNASTFLLRAFAYFQKDDLDLAITDCDQAIALEPEMAWAYFLRGFAYLVKGDDKRALIEISQASQLCTDECPEGFREYMQGMVFFVKEDFDQGIARVSQAIKLTTEPKILAWFLCTRGGAYAEKTDYVRALADFDQVVKLNPKWPGAYWARGHFLADTKNYERAIAEYTEAIKLDPTFTEGYKGRGDAYKEKRDYDKSIADYSKAISLNPNDPETYYYRGLTYVWTGNPDQALSDYNQAIKLKADYSYPYYYRAVVYELKGDLDRALDDINQYIKHTPSDETGYSYRGHIYTRKDDLDRALSDYDQAIKLKADYSNAYLQRSLVYERKGDIDQSIADLSQCIKLEPDQVKAYFNRGMAYANKGDRDQAIRDLKKVIELTSDTKIRQLAELTSGIKIRQLAEQKLQQLGVK